MMNKYQPWAQDEDQVSPFVLGGFFIDQGYDAINTPKVRPNERMRIHCIPNSIIAVENYFCIQVGQINPSFIGFL